MCENLDENGSFKKQIIDAYIWMRKNNNTIPDEVLDFMKSAALEKLEKIQLCIIKNKS